MKKLRLNFSVWKVNPSSVPASFWVRILGLVELGDGWQVAAKTWHLPA